MDAFVTKYIDRDKAAYAVLDDSPVIQIVVLTMGICFGIYRLRDQIEWDTRAIAYFLSFIGVWIGLSWVLHCRGSWIGRSKLKCVILCTISYIYLSKITKPQCIPTFFGITGK